MKRTILSLAFVALSSGAMAQQGGVPPGNAVRPQGSDVESLMRQFGLTGGPWSADCSRPESPSNWYGFFEIRDGRVTQVYSNSRQENRYEIQEATQLSSDRLRVRVRFSNPDGEDLQTLEWVVRDGRLRTFSNVSDRRGTSVTDGKTANGGETPWVSRCR
ncbi:MAG TPA: hypothetical protein PL193_14485 [Xanthobacteraceae bacterium]|nr:hypothetical protein [Xanthobacteraceae bacterium]